MIPQEKMLPKTHTWKPHLIIPDHRIEEIWVRMMKAAPLMQTARDRPLVHKIPLQWIGRLVGSIDSLSSQREEFTTRMASFSLVLNVGSVVQSARLFFLPGTYDPFRSVRSELASEVLACQVSFLSTPLGDRSWLI